MEETQPKRQTISIFWLPAYILPWVLIFLSMLLSYYTLPTPISIASESSYPNRFIGERAKILNLQLANLGPKVVGSDTNEFLAVSFLTSEIAKIRDAANPIHQIEMDVQKSSGSFELGTLTTYYQGIQNVVARIGPRNGTSTHSLLINTHYDSVPGSPGAGDAGTLVVVMLEILRVLSQLPSPLQHSVVFLFNSAEEFELNGSHLFITQHTWASNVRALINMDSCGTGGREVLFQSTAYPWLMNYYKKSVPYPTASVLGDELFKSGTIPSDTDFRIFRDFGNLRGLQLISYLANLFLYCKPFKGWILQYTETDTFTTQNMMHLSLFHRVPFKTPVIIYWR